MKTCEPSTLSIALRMLQQVSANYKLVVQLHSYQNRDHKDKNGYCCESYSRRGCEDHCDNKFYFCLLTRNNWGRYRHDCRRLPGIYPDNHNFGDSVRLVFYGLAPWLVSC